VGSKSRWAHLFPERKEKQVHLWETIGTFFRRYEQEWGPAATKLFVYREGWYLLLRAAGLTALLMMITTEVNIKNILILTLTAYLLLDLLIVNTSIAFVTMQPISNLRSFLLTLFAFTHIIVAFGIFYKFYGDQFNTTMCDSQILYFSTITITTLGYGDFVPKKSGTMVQILVIKEVLTGLFFVTGVLARVINRDK
jgi:hypothetical protein